jgi:sirohydrochlorin ferrochelatase
MTERRALILVDHGSRRAASNAMFEEFVTAFPGAAAFDVVKPAHMELADPSIGDAYDACVAEGATTVVVCPYFLLPGRHWDQDIPTLTAEAAARHPGTRFLVSAPIGLHPLMQDVISSRVDECIAHAEGDRQACALCEGTDKCALRDAGWIPEP